MNPYIRTQIHQTNLVQIPKTASMKNSQMVIKSVVTVIAGLFLVTAKDLYEAHAAVGAKTGTGALWQCTRSSWSLFWWLSRSMTSQILRAALKNLQDPSLAHIYTEIGRYI